MRLVALVFALFSGVVLAQNPRPRADVGPVANPTGGSATLSYLDAGTIVVENLYTRTDEGWANCINNLNQSTYSYGYSLATSNITFGGWLTPNCSGAQSTALARINMNLNNAIVNLIPVAATGPGTAAGPSWSFYDDINTGLYSVGADQLGVSTAGARSFSFSATAGRLDGVSANPFLSLNDASGACLNYTSSYACAANNSYNIDAIAVNITRASAIMGFVGGNILASTTPTVSSGFGTSPSVTAGKAMAFRVNVGTGGTANSGVIALGATATNGWNCMCNNITTSDGYIGCKQVAGDTTTVTVWGFSEAHVKTAWPASSILAINCVGY